MKILIDTREKKPYQFCCECEIEKKALPIGDYSLFGLENEIAVERKTLDDFVSSLFKKRFKNELQRAAGQLSVFVVVVEGSLGDVYLQRYSSHHSVNVVIGKINSLILDWGFQVLFCDSRAIAERTVYGLLEYEYRKRKKRKNNGKNQR